jgi:hypothetical protein
MGNWPVRTRGRGAGEERFGGRRHDRRPLVSDGDTVMGWQAGSCMEMGRDRRRAGPATKKTVDNDFSNLNHFSN